MRRWIYAVAVQLIKIIYECSQVVAARWLMFIAYDARIGSIIYLRPATASRRVARTIYYYALANLFGK